LSASWQQYVVPVARTSGSNALEEREFRRRSFRELKPMGEKAPPVLEMRAWIMIRNTEDKSESPPAFDSHHFNLLSHAS
jgi:hypothetical protein